MLNPLGQELTAEERQVEAALRHALLVLDKRSSLASIRAIAAQNPEEFVAAALGMLESKSDPAVRQKLYMDLLEGTEFLPRLLQSGRSTGHAFWKYAVVSRESTIWWTSVWHS
jgi:hypothetical protein